MIVPDMPKDASELSAKLAEFAKHYAELGYHVLPCNDPTDENPKAPRSELVNNGVKDASNDASVIEGWWNKSTNCNVGIAGGNGLIFIDLDVKDGKNGVEDLRRIAEDAGVSFPEDCPMAKTPSGGVHLYFRCENSNDYSNGTGIKYQGKETGIDVRADNSYVLAAPSAIAVQETGNVLWYEWERPLVPMNELPVLPEWLANALPKKRTPTTGQPQASSIMGNGKPLQTTDKMRRVFAYLDRTEEAISGQKGHTQTFAVLGRTCWGFDLTEPELRQAAEYYNETKCNPQWSVTELNHKIEEAMKWVSSDGRPRGHLLTEERAYQCGGGWGVDIDVNRLSEKKETSTQQGTPAMSEFDMPFDDLHKDGDFPLDAFPGHAKEFIEHTSRYHNQKAEVIAAALLAVAAGTIGNKRVLSVDSSWDVPSAIWVLMHGVASAGKTPIMETVRQLVDDYDVKKVKEYSTDRAQYDEDLQEYKKELKAFKKDKKRREAKELSIISGGDADDPQDEGDGVKKPGNIHFNFNLEDMGPEPPEKPFNESFMVETATVEGVRKKMDSNGGYVLVVCDEFNGFLKGFNQYNNADGAVDRSFWNKTYDGGNARILRAGTPESVIPRATASILGTIQTEIFEREVLKNRGYREEGFLARYFVVEVERTAYQKGRPSIPENVKKNMEKVMEYLCKMRWSGCTFGEKPLSRDRKPVVIHLDSEAVTLYEEERDFYDKWIDSRPNDDFNAILGKLASRATRIALVLHCMGGLPKSGCKNSSIGEPKDGCGRIDLVSKETMEAAIRINFWFAYELYQTFFGEKQSREDAKKTQEAEEALIREIKEMGGILKKEINRGTTIDAAKKRMIKNLVKRGKLVEKTRKTESGQSAKYIVPR